LDVQDVALTVTFAGLYAALVILLAPISYGPIQLRVADCLIPLSAIFGWPVVAGVTVGCLVGNAYYFPSLYPFLGSIALLDLTLGPLANLISALTIFALRRRRFLACVVGSLPIGLIVGGYLWLFFPPPSVLAFLPIWLGMVVSITVSSLIAVAGIGYGLLTALSRPSVVEPLRSRGLKVVSP